MADDNSARVQQKVAALVTTASRPQPTVGVVIPVYHHSMLVAEAVRSVLDQSLQPPPHAVIVDDGCDFPETSEICRGLAAAHPDRVTYLRRTNGGLSAARNTGIAYLLRSFPHLRAIYFLDADNRLRRDALEGALRRLETASDAGWVYPNLSMFGVTMEVDYGGPYSHLLQRATNQCEAGSLVRADVFRQGARFDEGMRQGYEDWSFFLSLTERGWRGEHLDDFGLEYRRRGESMLTDSTRMHGELESHLRRKHRRAFAMRTLLNLEHQEAPRYAIFLADRGEFLLATDPRKVSERVDISEFARRYWASENEPSRSFFSPFLVMTSQAAIDQLNAAGLLPYALWRLEMGLAACSLSFLVLGRERVESVSALGPVAAGPEDQIHLRGQLAMMRLQAVREVIADPVTSWIDTLITARPLPQCHGFTLQAPALESAAAPPPPIPHAIGYVLSLLRNSPWREGAEQKIARRHPGVMPRWFSYDVLRRTAGAQDAAVLPVVASPSERHIGFVFPLFAFGGVEKSAGEAARVFRSRGWKPHLFVGPEMSARLPDSLSGVFETTTLIDGDTIGSWGDHASFLGTPMPSLGAAHHMQPRLVGLMGWLDAVMNCHSAGAHAAMSLLRQAGLVTLCHQHVIDQSPVGRPVGQPMLGLAYEHAYDHIVCCSQSLAQWCIGMGTPPSKVLVAPNAPGYPLSAAEAGKIVASRQKRSPGSLLRVLFSGRLDRQKGVEQLLETIALGQARGLPIEWRIVGDAVLDRELIAEALAIPGVERHPAAYTTAKITKQYAWADVVFMPSRWEGLPLTLLEAMRVGAVPVATDVGAVSEICISGKTGELVDPAGNIALQAIEILSSLATDRVQLQKLSAASVDLVSQRSWASAFSPVVDAVEARIRARATKA